MAILLAGVTLLVAVVLADNNYTQQPVDAYGNGNGNNNNNNNAGQTGGYDQQHQPTKAKKIQIVYIKVPLAKLKPSLASSDSYSANGASANNNQSSYGVKGHDSSK